MTPKRPRPRWLRWLRWLGLFIVCWITIIPTLQALWMRRQVVSGIRSAQSIRLEEFHVDQVLAKVELDAKQRDAAVSALPIVPDIGLPGPSILLCWFPHHRIVMTNADGREVSFDVCFSCDEISFDRGRIMMMPYLWHSSLRQLFIDHKIPIRTRREYSKLLLQEREH